MTKQITLKYNDACIKLFEFLKMLYEGDVEFKKVINHFSDGSYDGTSNTHVTLNKFLNALKIFGINVKKVKHYYTIQNPVFKSDFNCEDFKCLLLLYSAYKKMPEGKNKKRFEKFLRALKIRFNADIQKDISVEHNLFPQISCYTNAEIIELANKCKRYCEDEFKLEVVYTDTDGNIVNLLCSPQDVVYKKKRIFLNAIGANGNRVYEIPIENIKLINQTGSKISENFNPTTIVFRIKNRLAKNYKMRDCEHLQTLESNGNKVIVNQGEDLDLLLGRLMKYGRECEVVSPKFYKEEILNRINKTLSNYQ